MGSFYGTPCTKIAYKCCILFAKTEFRVPNIVLNHWKIHSRNDSQDAINSIRRSTNDGERATDRRQWRQSSVTSFVLSPFADTIASL